MKKVAIRAAKEAGASLLKRFHNISSKDVYFKDKHEIVTTEDYRAEKIILKHIKQNYPEHSILSEEGGGKKRKSDYLWVIDPLDGTTNYSMGNPLYAVSIALFKNSEVILGVVYAPYMKELYVAEKGKGAYLNGNKLKVSNLSSVGKSMLTYCHGHRPNDRKRAIEIYGRLKQDGRDVRQLGAASLELGFVADGRTETIVIPGAHSWDVGSGVLLVREAGGKVTDFKGNEWKLSSKDMLASNGKVHKALLKVVSKY
ncbi:inositol monophosphatase [Patescibacteria group bacterium]|nr:inositol monophosphatase [Patescibacteria group bacterium]MBU1952553.1 inositol monophosphatase [Patescibacteria group bacterium]MBU2235511.1 inositol monophosphatase [Patescibacteria group bacterium]